MTGKSMKQDDWSPRWKGPDVAFIARGRAHPCLISPLRQGRLNESFGFWFFHECGSCEGGGENVWLRDG